MQKEQKMKIFTDLLLEKSQATALVESLDDDKAELCDFIKGLEQDEFAELMDVLSSIMMDPLAIGDEDDSSHEIEGDKEIKDVIDDGASPEEVKKALEESESEINERGRISAAERLKVAKEKKRDPRIKKMNKIKNAWRKKCRKRKLAAQKQESGKWGCGSTNHALSLLAKKYQHNRQTSVKA
jgi:hypothetical protein